jgi:diguanylate cyclase (GGDEF)-like protein/PAS domain S-box-containing protein
LGVAFAVLIALLAGIGQFGLRRMRVINETLNDITDKQSAKLELAQDALMFSNRNSRITMEVFLVQDGALIQALLAARSENTRKISELTAEIGSRCESEKEKHLLARVLGSRQPYIESYLRALHLLVNEKKSNAAATIMVNETLPALLKYHAAWQEFVDFQKNQLELGTKQAERDYAKARRLASLLIMLAVAVALVIAAFTTQHAQKSDQRSEIQLQNNENKYRVLFEDSADANWLMDGKGFLDCNSAALQMFGYTNAAEMKHPADISPPNQPDGRSSRTMAEQKMSAAFLNGKERFEWLHQRKNGDVFPAEVCLTALTLSGRPRLLATVRDISDRKVAEERVQYLAYYDALTELPNRTLLHDRLAKALADARRQKYKIALLFLDLDGFKDINDSLGHSVGDLLLQEVADRLKKFAREQDTLARLGGDEFLIMLTHIKDIPDAAVATERLMDAMTAEFVIEGRHLNVSCSVGISIFPEHGADGETLIKNADVAMYCAKMSGRNNFRFFIEDMNAQAVERLTLENSLRRALEKRELFLVYQPQMDIVSGKIIGLEALLRWQHPELGLVPPDRFIRIAENSGLIVPIGEWVLRTACSQARKWQVEGLPAVSVAVNVSAIQFRQEDFCELIGRVLHETGLAPQYLELELTESLLLANADVMLSVVEELKAIGVTLAIDDFGTGYSNFNYLRRFQVSKLKIDRSFIQDVAVKPDDAAITTAIISMARSLNLKVIAEGVEDEAQMTFLRANQCDEIQGYYFSKPLAVDKVADKLRGNNPEPHARAQASGKQS